MVNIKYKIKQTLLVLAVIILYACKSKYEVKYDFPKEMLHHVKEQYKSQCERGKILWDLNCARCHNYIEKRKVLVPDFKESQLRGYELRIANAKHERNLSDSIVTEEELGIIMIFLKYKEKNN
jgi:hypothetical protein